MTTPDFKAHIAEVPDFPKPGIGFKDMTPLLASPTASAAAIETMTGWYKGQGIGAVVAAEARGFWWGGAIALGLGAGLIPVRKRGKLPRATVSATYALEYGTDELFMHQDAFAPGTKVLIFDDVLATGGTAGAMVALVEKLGGTVTSLAFVIELGFLKGREKLGRHDVRALIAY